jgi:glycosyltransferase involved in cell wall biosynthesis
MLIKMLFAGKWFLEAGFFVDILGSDGILGELFWAGGFLQMNPPEAPARQLKIGFFAPSLYMPDTGGAEILMDRLVASLQSAGHQVVVVAPRRRGDQTSLAYPVVRTLRPFTKKWVNHALVPLLWAWYRHRFEILHCQGEFQAAWVGWMFSRLTGVPYVVRATGGGFETAQTAPRCRFCIQTGLAGAARVVAQGSYLHEAIRGYGVPTEKIVTIHNGVYPTAFSQSASPIEVPFIFFNGGLKPVKGCDLLVRAFARIRDQIPPTCLVIAGNGRSERTLLALLEECGLDKTAVRWTGILSQTEQIRYLQHALCFAAPYRYSPFPNAVLEAMAAGLPVVASALGGHIEQIRPELDEGILVPDGDVEALALALRQICLDAGLRTRLAAGARRRGAEFTWNGMLAAYEQLYRGIADGRMSP